MDDVVIRAQALRCSKRNMVGAVTAILVAETDPDVRDLLTDILRIDFAATVSSYSTGERAAAAIATGAFDLAIIDVGLPEISGYELAARAANMNIPTLLCTGHPDAVAKLKQVGCPHLAKPFQINDLVCEAAVVMVNATENIRRVKASLTKLRLTVEGLEADIAESRRLIIESRRLLTDRQIKPLMRIYVFASLTDPKIIGFTLDEAGDNLPRGLGPWNQEEIPGVIAITQVDDWISDKVERDGFCVVDEKSGID
jgi:CheY-like chemotaxis protein